MPTTTSEVSQSLRPHGQVGVQAVAGVEHPEPHVAGEHRCLQRLGQFPHRLGRVLGASAHHDQRTTGLPEDSGGLFDLPGVDGRLGGSGRFEDAVGRLAPHVDRHLHSHRTGNARHQLVDCLLPHAGGVDAAPDVAGVLGQLAQDRGGVGQVVQYAGAAAPPFRGEGPDQSQHLGVAPVGAGEAGRGVEHPGAGNHAQRGRTACDLGRAQGHVGRSLLMAGHDGPYVAGVDEGIEEVVVLHPRQAEQGVHAQRSEGFYREMGDRRGLRQRMLDSCSHRRQLSSRTKGL